MFRKFIIIILLYLFTASADAQSADRHGFSPEPRIVIKNCEESPSRLIKQMIKYYMDLGDLDSADVLIQIAKKYQPSAKTQPMTTPLSKQGDVRRSEDFRQGFYGYF